MTKIIQEEFVCCNCGAKSKHDVVISASGFGSPDLDFRPPSRMRNIIYHTIQRCPNCGYCSNDISECKGKIDEIVSSKTYQDILNNTAIPDKARSYLAAAYINETFNRYSVAANQTVYAAWICDDENNTVGAKFCREKAIDLIFHKGKKGETYNIGGDNEWKNIDLVETLCDLTDKYLKHPVGNSRKLITFVKDRPGHDRRYAIDFSKLNKELGWKPEMDFIGGLKKTIEWYLSNPGWVDKVRSGEYREYYEKQYGSRL